MTRPVLLVSDDPGSPSGSAMLAHIAGPGHPERPERLSAVWKALQSLPGDRCRWLTAVPAKRSMIEGVHSREYTSMLESRRGQSFSLDPDTGGSARTLEAAYLAAGACVQLVEALARGDAYRGMALVRPPGHHAERGRAMGFCLFDNIAVAAAHVVASCGVERVLIVDWDVHHGNGTQHLFEDRRDVLVFNIHEDGNYPGTGAIEEIGLGEGAGFTVNVPLRSGAGDADYLAVIDEVLEPIASRFRPELVLVSAGFDAHARDPLGGMMVSGAGFGAMCARVMKMGSGRLGLVLEGGYDLGGLTEGVAACALALMDEAPSIEAGEARPETRRVIERVRAMHHHWFDECE